MEKKILKTIKEHNLIQEGENIVVGVSGGPDSMFLVSILYKLKKQMKFNIIVAHVNHSTRGIETDKDEEFVKKYCKDRNIKFHSTRVDMNGYAKEKNISSEEAGRELRYSFFRKISKEYGNGSIAVAHNKNDQAETMIMRFLRGSGIDGLKGMGFKSHDIIRPILDISREDIETYILKNNIEVRIDETNKMYIYRRNKIRLDLIPKLEEEYNPSIIDTLYRTSRIMNTDSEFINDYAREKFDKSKIQISKSKVILNIDIFNQNHSAIKYRIIRRAIEKTIGNLKDIEQVHIENIISLIDKKETGKKVDLPNHIEAYIDYNQVHIRIKKSLEKEKINYELSLNEKSYIKELDLEIELRTIDSKNNEINKKDMFIKCFDYDKIEGGLYMRFRQAGDRFRPLGMKGSKKLKDFFIDEKVSREKRNEIPLICDSKGILWVVNNRISEDYKIDENTEKVLVISIKKRRNKGKDGR